MQSKAVCIYPSTVSIASESAVTIEIIFLFTIDCAISIECISPYCRLQLFLVYSPKKPLTQNLRWFLKILLTAGHARQKYQLKTFYLNQKNFLLTRLTESRAGVGHRS